MTQEEMKEARRLLLKAHRSGISNFQIRRITGVCIKTIVRWIEKMPEYQGAKTDRVIAGFKLLDFEHYIPVKQDRKERYANATRFGEEWTKRLFDALDRMNALGYSVNQVSYISGIGQDHVRRLMKPEHRESKVRMTTHVAVGVDRLEIYLHRRGNDRRRSAREEFDSVRRSRDMGGAEDV